MAGINMANASVLKIFFVFIVLLLLLLILRQPMASDCFLIKRSIHFGTHWITRHKHPSVLQIDNLRHRGFINDSFVCFHYVVFFVSFFSGGKDNQCQAKIHRKMVVNPLDTKIDVGMDDRDTVSRLPIDSGGCNLDLIPFVQILGFGNAWDTQRIIDFL